MSDGQGGAAGAGAEGEPGGEGGGAAGGAAGGQGGAAGLLGGGGEGAGAAAGQEGGEGGGAAAGQEGGEGGGEQGAAWFDIFSDKAATEGQAAAREWVKSKGWKDPDAMIASMRELEGRFLSGDKIVLPKEGDGPEVVEAFHKAIGRPDAPDKYDIKLGEGEELNDDLAKIVREAAFKAGMPASMFGPVADAFNGYMRDTIATADAAQAQQRDQGVADYRREVGDKFNVNIAAGNRAMRMLELDGATVAKIEQGLGTKETLALFAKLGHGMSEDILLDAGGRQKFSMSASDAQAELDRLSKEPGYLEKLKSDPAAKSRRDHLLQVVAAAETRKREADG